MVRFNLKKLVVCLLAMGLLQACDSGDVKVAKAEVASAEAKTELSKVDVVESEVQTDVGPHAGKFSGSQTCAECHQKEYADWKESDHSRAMDVANEKTVLANFDNQSLTVNGIKHRFYRADNGDFMVETDNETGVMTPYKIEYVLGFDPLQQYMVHLPGGRIQCLHTAWDDVKKEWFHLYKNENPPAGDWLHWTGQGMTWNTQCSECHTTGTEINYDRESNTYNTKYTEMNVTCESCHGGGVDHIKHQKGDKSVNDTILKLNKLKGATQKQELDRCASCHGLRSRLHQSADPHGSNDDNFVMDFPRMTQYQLDGQLNTEAFEFGSFTQSKMYHLGVRCTDCHNPHTMKPKFKGNALCTQCHVKEKYDDQAHHFHTAGTEGASCVSCHMPGQHYMGVDLRHDHSFRVPRPDLSIKYGTPNACNKCHDDKTAVWASNAVVSHFGKTRMPHFSEQLMALRTGEQGSVEKAIQLLSNPGLTSEMGRAVILSELPARYSAEVVAQIERHLKDPSVLLRKAALEVVDRMPNSEKVRLGLSALKDERLAIRQEAAFGLSSVPAEMIPAEYKELLAQAEKELEDGMKASADSPGGLLRYGVFKERKGDSEMAVELFKHSLRVDILFHPARFTLATHYNRVGKNDLAIKELQIITEQYPTIADGFLSLGQVLAEEERFMEAQAEFAKAAALPNCPPHVYRNWGIVFEKMQMYDKAIKIYEKGLQVNPYNNELRQFIQRLRSAAQK